MRFLRSLIIAGRPSCEPQIQSSTGNNIASDAFDPDIRKSASGTACE
jgi:hypothetical protein